MLETPLVDELLDEFLKECIRQNPEVPPEQIEEAMLSNRRFDLIGGMGLAFGKMYRLIQTRDQDIPRYLNEVLNQIAIAALKEFNQIQSTKGE